MTPASTPDAPGAILPTAEPFFFPGGETGCLLVHGFTGTPQEMREMGETLAAAGHSVLGVRLAGHATRPQDLARARWQDWLTSVEDGWHLLRGAARRIYVIGLSLGGILALVFAARFPVDGVVALSTPYTLPPDPRLRFLPLLKALVPRVAKGPDAWHDPQAAEGHVVYPYIPTPAVAELGALLEVMRAALPQVSAPVLLIHSRQDQDVAPESMQRIYARLGSPDKERLWVDGSSHNLVRDRQRQVVYRAAADFIHRRSPSP